MLACLPLPTQNASSRLTLYVCESSLSTFVAAAKEAEPALAFSETMVRWSTGGFYSGVRSEE